MKRFRTGRSAPPWAGGQTGPMTADVEALMSSRDRDPVKYVSLPAEFAQHSAQIHTEALYAERVDTEANFPEYEGTAANIHTEASYAERLAAVAAATPEAAGDEPALDAEASSHSATVKLVYIPPDSSPEDANALVERAVTEVKRESQVYTPAAEAGETGSQVERATAIAPKRSHHKRKRAKRKPRPIPTLKEVTLRPAAPRKKSHPKTHTEIDLSHHERRCSICHHPDREAIEEAFLQWRRVKNIDFDFKPEGGPTAIYRHARALKLFKQRNLGLRSALEFVIERAENVMPTADGLVKAIRAYTRINDAGEWIDTPTTHIVKVMPMRDPEPRNVTNSASPRPDEGRGSITLDVKKISDCPREGKVEVTIESPSGRPLLTGSAPQTEIDATT